MYTRTSPTEDCISVPAGQRYPDPNHRQSHLVNLYLINLVFESPIHSVLTVVQSVPCLSTQWQNMDLWSLAAARLRDKDKKTLDFGTTVDLQDLLSSVKDSKDECQRKQWVVNNVVLRRSVDPEIHRSGRYSYPIRSWTCCASVGCCTIRSYGVSNSSLWGISVGSTNL